jgi:alkylation response protein AidB-like acyl-CoA dehydrogenase
LRCGWLEANLSVSLRGRTTRPPPAELMPWYHMLPRKGWIAPHWPKQFGGMGASLNEQIIMTEELARIGARTCRCRVSTTSGRS